MAHDSQSSGQEWRDNNIAGSARVIFGNVVNHIHMTESLAQEVIRSCHDSSKLFHSLAKEVAWFRSLLELTKSNVAELNPTYQFSRDIETVITGISHSFTEIQRSVQRFEDLPTGTQWTWELHQATDEIKKLQEMLDTNFKCLSNLNSTLSSYSQTAIIRKLEKFFRDVQSGSRQESRSSLDSLNADEAEAWRMVRKHLEDVGITPQLFDQHHTLIKDSILEAIVSGKLDEDVMEDQEEDTVNDYDVLCGSGNGGIYPPHHNSAGFSSSTNVSPDGFNLDEEGTPQRYTHRIIDNSGATEQLQGRSESLRAQSIGVSEEAPLPPATNYISAIYHTPPDPCHQYALSADCPVILSYEEAKSKLKEEQEMWWVHLQNPQRRLVQNSTNQYKTKWMRKFYLETAQDYHILVHEYRNRRKGLKHEREGRLIGFYDQPGVKRCTNNHQNSIE